MKVEILKQKGHRFLWIDNYLWMWDTPIEKKIQKQIADQAFGDVLVAGYGLGLVQEYLSNNPTVNFIFTIELHTEVINAVFDIEKERGGIFGMFRIADFYTLPFADKYDCVIGDIWEDIVPESLEAYKKFKEKAKQLIKPDGKILAWGQEFFEYLIEKENKC